jgi:hypothetical protein
MIPAGGAEEGSVPERPETGPSPAGPAQLRAFASEMPGVWDELFMALEDEFRGSRDEERLPLRRGAVARPDRSYRIACRVVAFELVPGLPAASSWKA